MTSRRVAWQRIEDLPGDEQCTLSIRDGRLSLIGTLLGAHEGTPVRVEYRILTDGGGLTSAVHLRLQRGFELRTLTLNRDPKGRWSVDGTAAPKLRGCTDVDLGFSPATNTLPIRRLGLPIGASTTISAAYVRYPELSVEKAAQTYTRLDEFGYRYASGSFEDELTVDADGLVIRYGPWRRTGLAVGPDDTPPLDARPW